MRLYTIASAALLAATISAQGNDGSMPAAGNPTAPVHGPILSNPQATCIQVNAASTANTTTGWATAWFWHETTNTTGNAINVTGFDFLCTTTAPKSIATGIFTPVGNPPTGFTQVSTGTMSVGATSSRYSTKTAPPVAVAAAAVFYVGLSINGINQEAASGSLTTYYWSGNNPPRAWSHRVFAWDVDCDGGNYTTFGTGCKGKLSATGVPEVGKSFSVDQSGLAANSVNSLFIGASKTAWGPLTLPFDVTPFGAPGCTLYASGEIQVAGSSDANGDRSVTISIPNDVSLKGKSFYNQGLTIEAVNTLGVTFTDGGEALIG